MNSQHSVSNRIKAIHEASRRTATKKARETIRVRLQAIQNFKAESESVLSTLATLRYQLGVHEGRTQPVELNRDFLLALHELRQKMNGVHFTSETFCEDSNRHLSGLRRELSSEIERLKLGAEECDVRLKSNILSVWRRHQTYQKTIERFRSRVKNPEEIKKYHFISGEIYAPSLQFFSRIVGGTNLALRSLEYFYNPFKLKIPRVVKAAVLAIVAVPTALIAGSGIVIDAILIGIRYHNQKPQSFEDITREQEKKILERIENYKNSLPQGKLIPGTEKHKDTLWDRIFRFLYMPDLSNYLEWVQKISDKFELMLELNSLDTIDLTTHVKTIPAFNMEFPLFASIDPISSDLNLVDEVNFKLSRKQCISLEMARRKKPTRKVKEVTERLEELRAQEAELTGRLLQFQTAEFVSSLIQQLGSELGRSITYEHRLNAQYQELMKLLV